MKGIETVFYLEKNAIIVLHIKNSGTAYIFMSLIVLRRGRLETKKQSYILLQEIDLNANFTGKEILSMLIWLC